jgi:regulation of enolase protein 1 (concanavalin A-like superfamily)
MCALGVACEVAWLNGAPVNREVIDTVRGDYDVLYDGYGGSLPTSVMRWYGIGTDNPSLARNIDVMKANDTCEWSFAQIADALEKKYKLKEEEAPKTEYPATKIEFYLQKKDNVNA